MANEFIFLLHVVLTISFSLGMLVLGRGALFAAIALQAVFANLFVIKQISLFGFSVTAADAYIVGCMMCSNFLQEFYGKKSADMATWVFAVGFIWYVAAGWVHLAYNPLPADWAQPHFFAILKHAPRIVFASLIALFTAMRINSLVFYVVPSFLGLKVLWLRNLVSIGLSQFADTAIFAFLGLYGLVESVWQIIFVATTIKILVVSLASPFSEIARFLVKKRDV
ncbi:queuosine precursor transporter [Candidatus Dependentiae bacterium]